MGTPDTRYETVKDYVCLALGVVLSGAAIYEGVVGDVQLGIAFLGGSLTCLGLVPTLTRDKER